jgi:GGDEF domain-containing protein
MQVFTDYYRTLQVHHEASQEVIEAAYRRLCRIYHPDINHEPQALGRMQEINAAYEVLSAAAQRRAYHREWLAMSERRAAPRPQAAPQPPRQNPTELAQQVLDGYFRCLMDNLWDEAYAKLTAADHRNVPMEDFRQWKATVAECYSIGSYAIKPFRRYFNCTVSGVAYREVFEFSVFVCDMDARIGHISEENYLKYVVLDGGHWRVCLGYSDVKPLILRFKYLQENAALMDPAQVYAEAVMSRDRHTGLLSREGFTEKAEAEATRSRRYGNLFTVSLLIIRPRGQATAFTDQEYAGMCMVHAAKTIGRSIRQTDILARWGQSELVILFTETPRENAGFAMEILMEKLARCEELKYDVAFGLAEFDGFQLEDTMAAAASNAQVRKMTSDGVTKTYITMNDSP